jgi:hypothetical protein
MRCQKYECKVCKDTKTIIAHPKQSTARFEQELPDELPCTMCWVHGNGDNYMEKAA